MQQFQEKLGREVTNSLTCVFLSFNHWVQFLCTIAGDLDGLV